MIVSALARLKDGTGTHSRHVGIRVRITKQAVAREARVSSATLYRFPDLIKEVEAASEAVDQKLRPAEARRAAAADRIEELERQVAKLLSENLRLSRALLKFDPTLGRPEPVELDAQRAARKASGHSRKT
jgi:transposase-like protein